MTMTFTYFSMFSGIGGFELGIQNAYGSKNRGKQTDSETNQGQGLFSTKGKGSSAKNGRFSECFTNRVDQRPFCVGFSEIDKHAIQIYQRHYPEHRNYGDATKIDPKTLPDFDMLCGGFPCQSFSVAGKRQGFKDTRGTLFFEICRIASEKRPRMLFLENVKGLLNHDGGQTFQTISSTMDELGYDVEWQVLNSKNFGVPQNRERVFIIGHLRAEPLCRHQIFPLGESDTGDTDAQEEARGIGPRVRGDNTHIARTIAERDYKGGQLVADLIVHNLQPRSPDRPSLQYSSGGSGHLHVEDGYTYCLDSGNCQAVEHMSSIRRLTPVECERLQGFPDGWTSDISDTQRYKCLGNAVTVNVIEVIASQIKEALL